MPALGIALAVLAVPAFALTDVKETLARRRVETALLESCLRARPPRQEHSSSSTAPGLTGSMADVTWSTTRGSTLSSNR